MTQEHPITPPPELVKQWSIEAEHEHQPTVAYSLVSLLATKAARWGADQELEACRLWVSEESIYAARELVEARRPKPPSLKAQALEALDEEHADMRIQNYRLIRSVLESLPD